MLLVYCTAKKLLFTGTGLGSKGKHLPLDSCDKCNKVRSEALCVELEKPPETPERNRIKLKCDLKSI